MKDGFLFAWELIKLKLRKPKQLTAAAHLAKRWAKRLPLRRIQTSYNSSIYNRSPTFPL